MSTNPAIIELEKVEKDLLLKLKGVQSTMAMLKGMYSTNGEESANGSETHNLDKYRDFDKKATFRDKLTSIFRTENRFLHIREIAEIMHSIEPKYSVKEFLAKLSPAITYLRKEGAIVKCVVGKSHLNTFWGSKNWVNADGTPKAQHMYDENQINNSRKSEEITI